MFPKYRITNIMPICFNNKSFRAVIFHAEGFKDSVGQLSVVRLNGWVIIYAMYKILVALFNT